MIQYVHQIDVHRVLSCMPFWVSMQSWDRLYWFALNHGKEVLSGKWRAWACMLFVMTSGHFLVEQLCVDTMKRFEESHPRPFLSLVQLSGCLLCFLSDGWTA